MRHVLALVLTAVLATACGNKEDEDELDLSDSFGEVSGSWSYFDETLDFVGGVAYGNAFFHDDRAVVALTTWDGANCGESGGDWIQQTDGYLFEVPYDAGDGVEEGMLQQCDLVDPRRGRDGGGGARLRRRLPRRGVGKVCGAVRRRRVEGLAGPPIQGHEEHQETRRAHEGPREGPERGEAARRRIGPLRAAEPGPRHRHQRCARVHFVQRDGGAPGGILSGSSEMLCLLSTLHASPETCGTVSSRWPATTSRGRWEQMTIPSTGAEMVKTKKVLGWAGLGWVGLGWAGRGGAGLGWVAAHSGTAHALEWFETELSYSGTAVGVSIRNWGVTGDNFLFVEDGEVVGPFDADENTVMYHYTCDAAGGGYDYCETVTLQDTETVGSAMTVPKDNGHAMHPASALRHLSAGEYELTMTRAEEEGTFVCPDVGGMAVWDIVSYVYRTPTASIVDTLPVQRADDAADCADHGKTEVKYLGSVAHACYTANPGSEVVQCNHDDGGPDEWSSPEDLPAASQEDHPSFVFDGSARVVGVHAYTPAGNNGIEMRLADTTELLVSAYDTSDRNHPNLSHNDNTFRLVYHEGAQQNARIVHSKCRKGWLGDCSDYGSPTDPFDDWDVSYITDDSTGSNHYRSAKHAELVVDLDANREFVAFQYNANTDSDPHIRVVFATRCLNIATGWTFEEPRPVVGSMDQSLVYGTPALVLDRHNQMVHLAFAELGHLQGSTPDLTAGGDVFWLRASYAGLPSCP